MESVEVSIPLLFSLFSNIRIIATSNQIIFINSIKFDVNSAVQSEKSIKCGRLDEVQQNWIKCDVYFVAISTAT